MKETAVKGVITAALAALSVYLSQLAVPLILLFCAVIIDYLTGICRAYLHSGLSSGEGIRGILKKLSYFFAVSVGMVCDYILGCGIGKSGDGSLHFVALLLCFWLIVNELISILENLNGIGVPMPAFLLSLASHLKQTVDGKGNLLSPKATTDKSAEKEDNPDENRK